MSASMPSPRDRPQDRPGLQVQGLSGASGWILLGLVASSYSTSNSTASNPCSSPDAPQEFAGQFARSFAGKGSCEGWGL